MEFDPRIAGLEGDVVFFPVRHHSPLAARLVEQAIDRVRPRAVLIEGPAEFNDQWPDLLRDHALPIAIYSFVAREDGSRQSAFYPFCVYSPEWQALRAAAARGIEAEFIDLPWAELSTLTDVSHVFADGEERRASYTQALVERCGLESFDDLWDAWFEAAGLRLEEYLLRCHQLMFHIRASQPVPIVDQRREAFMAERIAAAQQRLGTPLLVVTGGYHSYGLFSGAAAVTTSSKVSPVVDRGIALTPYSYSRLDALTGYDSGMPNPGFYDRVWRQPGEDVFAGLLGAVAAGVRAKKQPVSAADLIAVETMARGLATLRGQASPWRRELLDAVRAALVKDDVLQGRHPLLDAVHAVLRGDAIGRLAEGTRLPPLVADIQAEVERHALGLERKARELRLDLTVPAELARASVLHRLAGLEIAGFTLKGGGALASRDDVTQVVENWKLEWKPAFEAHCIERAVYGATLEAASRARLEEQARQVERSAARAAAILFEASVQGHVALAGEFEQSLGVLIDQDSEFLSVTAALNTLLYLYRYDDVLGAGRAGTAGALLAKAYARGLWLVEAFMQAATPPGVANGIALLRETLLRTGDRLHLDASHFTGVFQRLAAGAVDPTLRGASAGVLWSLAALEPEKIKLEMAADPEELGDFLHGLFTLAREAVQRHPELMRRIDELLAGFDEEAFALALPALRLAFGQFAPREKHHLVRALLGTAGTGPKLAVDPATAARALAWEERVFVDLARYGVLA